MKATLSASLSTAIILLLGSLLLPGCQDSPTATVPDHCPNCNALLADAPDTSGAVETPSAMGLTLIGPYTHENLSIYLLAQPNAPQGQDYLTLDEALASKVLVIHETSDVNRLELENTGDKPIFLHSGEIVRGGKQDRMLQYDLIIKPKSGPIPLPVFCVESGRWNRRGTEAAGYFGSGGNMGGNDQKLAAIKSKDQSGVWASVSRSQADMETNAGQPVAGQASPSSLLLAMDNETVLNAVSEYTTALEPTLDGQPNVIGYAAVINGEVESIDLYESPALLDKLWSKLIKGSAMTAFSRKDKFDPNAPQATADDVLTMIQTVDAQAVQDSETVGDKQWLNTRDGDGTFGYELREEDRAIHRSYLRDDGTQDEGSDNQVPNSAPGNDGNVWPHDVIDGPTFNEQEVQERR
jgi:hypothetical protein